MASSEQAEEIAAVLSRPGLERYGVAPVDPTEVLALLAPLLPAVDVDSPLRERTDVPVVAGALAGKAEAIVTGDADFVADDSLRGWLRAHGVEVMTPREVLDRLPPGRFPSSC